MLYEEFLVFNERGESRGGGGCCITRREERGVEGGGRGGGRTGPIFALFHNYQGRRKEFSQPVSEEKGRGGGIGGLKRIISSPPLTNLSKSVKIKSIFRIALVEWITANNL